MTRNDLKRIIEAYNNFTAREYNDMTIGPDDIRYDTLYIAYTTGEDSEGVNREYEIGFDVKQMKYINLVDQELFELPKQERTIEEIINELNYCSFDDMVSEGLYYISNL